MPLGMTTVGEKKRDAPCGMKEPEWQLYPSYYCHPSAKSVFLCGFSEPLDESPEHSSPDDVRYSLIKLCREISNLFRIHQCFDGVADDLHFRHNFLLEILEVNLICK